MLRSNSSLLRDSVIVINGIRAENVRCSQHQIILTPRPGYKIRVANLHRYARDPTGFDAIRNRAQQMNNVRFVTEHNASLRHRRKGAHGTPLSHLIILTSISLVSESSRKGMEPYTSEVWRWTNKKHYSLHAYLASPLGKTPTQPLPQSCTEPCAASEFAFAALYPHSKTGHSRLGYSAYAAAAHRLCPSGQQHRRVPRVRDTKQ